MLGHHDSLDHEVLAQIRASVVKGKGWLAEKVAKLFLEATGGQSDPTAETAAFWRANPDKFITLCETHSNVQILLALGVPVDLISQKLYEKHLVQLPFWQSNKACRTHPEVAVLQTVPGQYVLLQCKRCLLTMKVVP